LIQHEQFSPQGILNWFIEKHDPNTLFFGAYEPLDAPVKILTLKKNIPVHYILKHEAIKAGTKAEECLPCFYERVHYILKHEAIKAGTKAEECLPCFYERVHPDDQELWTAFHRYPSLQALCVAFRCAFYEEQDYEKAKNITQN
jgi:hypothetical protein